MLNGRIEASGGPRSVPKHTTLHHAASDTTEHGTAQHSAIQHSTMRPNNRKHIRHPTKIQHSHNATQNQRQHTCPTTQPRPKATTTAYFTTNTNTGNLKTQHKHQAHVYSKSCITVHSPHLDALHPLRQLSSLHVETQPPGYLSILLGGSLAGLKGRQVSVSRRGYPSPRGHQHRPAQL